MNPTHLTLRNVGRFADLDLDIPTGSLAIAGANGSGKSTLLRAIDLALFADGSRDLAPCLAPWADRLEITLTFEHAGDLYRVRRTYEGRGRGKATLDFEWWEDDPPPMPNWVPLARENAAATQGAICAVLGMNRATFNASAFLAQGNSAAFPDATAFERKALLGQILDPRDYWPTLATKAGDERRTLEQAIVADQARIQDGLQQTEQLPELLAARDAISAQTATANAQVTLAETNLEAAQAAYSEAQAATERLRALTAERDAAAAAEQAAARHLQECREADLAITAAQVELDTLGAVDVDDLERKVERQRELVEARREALRQRFNLEQEWAAIQTEIERVALEGVRFHALADQHLNKAAHIVESAAATCVTCGQPLADEETKQRVIDGLEAQAAEAMAQARDHLAEVEALEQKAVDARTAVDAFVIPDVPAGDYTLQLAQARQAETRRVQLETRISGWRVKAAQTAEAARVHDEASVLAGAKQVDLDSARGSGDVIDLSLALGAVNVAKTTLAVSRQQAHDAAVAEAAINERITTLRQTEVAVAALQAKTAQTQNRIDLLKLAERAFGRDGIPALIVENVVGTIETETNRLLQLMPTTDGETFRVELRTQRALKTADHLKETLDIVVSDRDGERAYETYSGGEQARINICLRIALALLLADRRGAESRLLAVDELEYLDLLGQEQLVTVIGAVADRFDRVIVVSHVEGIRDAFDQTIRIVKDGGVSRVLSDTPAMAAA